MAFNITIYVNSSIYCYVGDVMNIHEKLLREISNEMLQKGDNAYSNTCSEAADYISDLSLRIAVAAGVLKTDTKNLWTTNRFLQSILTMPIESLHEFIKNNPQYGDGA